MATPGVVRMTFLAPSEAVGAIAKVAVTVVEFGTVRPLTVTPVPDTDIDVTPVRPVPVRVTLMLVPCTPVLGVIEVRLGGF
jgi:hypothetical protein